MTGAEIRAARLALGLRQAELARLLGYSSASRVSEVETDKWPASATVVRLLHAYLEGYRPADWPDRVGSS